MHEESIGKNENEKAIRPYDIRQRLENSYLKLGGFGLQGSSIRY